jgi:hypothetical protein
MIVAPWEEAMRFSIALVALIVAAATTAEAQDTQSADTIIRGCRSLVSDSTIDDPTDSFLAGICAGTIDGLAYEASILKLSSASAPHAEVFCIPKEIKIDQQIRVVVKYIDARPERMHERFALLALLALIEACPCQS